MMRKKLIFLLFCAGVLLWSCSLDDDSPNFHFTALKINAANLPESFELNETYEVVVDYTLPNNCALFDGFEVTQEDTAIRNVVAIGSVRTDQVGCREETIEAQASFNFTVIHDQPYTFKFYQSENSAGENEYLEVIVPVN
ncbi:hypothetical protein [Maribacter antarcticus]|uniref:hypothetical protein n=1 Tax=Maribacter antarcticus TaxID=505250 RepID=UPI000B08DC41|nr:hypothetical protein [Maribacter antarcticus]